jgi:hypothetical protein
MACRKPPNPAEAKRIAALEAEGMEAARRESVQIREEALARFLAEVRQMRRGGDAGER